MGSLFRSQHMSLCQFFLQSEAAYSCVAELGELGVAQFRDLNSDVSAFQRKFVAEVRRCDELERILRFLEKECHKESIPLLHVGGNPPAPLPRELFDMESTLQRLETEMKEVNNNYEALEKNAGDLLELKYVLKRAQVLFDEEEILASGSAGSPSHAAKHAEASASGLLAYGDLRREGQISFVAGTILQQKVQAFERLMWRISRGTVLLRTYDIETELRDYHTGEPIRKSTFFAFFQGEQLRQRVRKICEAFRATVFPCPDSPREVREMLIQVMTRIEDLQTLLSHTQDHRRTVIVAAAKNIETWTVKIRKIKAIYALMNCFNIDITQRCFVGEAWCPTSEMDNIRIALAKGTQNAECGVPSIVQPIKTGETPPTFHKTNKFTSGFQAIVDAYGMATYREVNPTPFNVITFPFLFAVMFGDFGHGLVMTLLALFLVIKEKRLMQSSMGEIAETVFGGRYLILFMGLFSLYTGLVYNDVFSKSFNIFGSAWSASRDVYNFTIHPDHPQFFELNATTSDYNRENGPYTIGLDPVWVMATNKINFINSYKMKMSVIFGVLQMTFGIILSCFNHTYFKRKINIFGEFIPQVIFLMCMFGYLTVLIFYKWIVFDAFKSGCSPSLLIGLINMYLFKYEANPVNSNGTECTINTFYPHQKEVQTTLVIVGFLCIPWMLLMKPLYKKYHRGGSTYRSVNDSENGSDNGSHNDEHGEANQSFSDVMIYQAIHTIEFCLGVVSNTASYLRLWALSLAHSQLSEVLWTMVMRKGFLLNNFAGFAILFPVFLFWSTATLVILICMEGMSAFLHALRLHWVEFQNKFYGGTGHAFEPFDFKKLDSWKPSSDE